VRPTVELRDIVTEDDVSAVMALRRGPGRDRYIGTMISHFEDAVEYAQACPRKWSIHDRATGGLVGFAMISDNIPQDVLDADDDIVGPYFLWRLLIDLDHQGHGYGRATIDAVADYVRARPGGDALYVSSVEGVETPMTFYEHCGFVKTGRVADGEEVLRLDLAGRPDSANGGRA
jgi:diamine N-acetyltransferase